MRPVWGVVVVLGGGGALALVMAQPWVAAVCFAGLGVVAIVDMINGLPVRAMVRSIAVGSRRHFELMASRTLGETP